MSATHPVGSVSSTSPRHRIVLSRALEAAASAADGGLDAVVAAGQAALMGEPHVELVRVATVDGDTGSALDSGHSGSVRVTIAATVDGLEGSASRTFYVA
jgi:pantoate--beta-alanine ligase